MKLSNGKSLKSVRTQEKRREVVPTESESRPELRPLIWIHLHNENELIKKDLNVKY